MALGNNNSTASNKKYINLKLISGVGPIDNPEDNPKFQILGEDYKPTGESVTSVSGTLKKIVSSFTPKKGKMGDIYGFKAFLEDGDEVYVIESTITNASKDLLNALLPNIGKFLAISLYVNKNAYPTSSIKYQDGNWAQTSLEYNKVDKVELYNQIKTLESNEDSEISIEDLPF